MTRALITGGAGFVGSHLVSFLNDRAAELAVFATSNCGKAPGLHCYEVDVRDAIAVRSAIHDFRPDHLYHLAAVSSVGFAQEFPRVTYEVNVLGTLNVLEAAMDLPQPPRILNVSTAQVYAPSKSPLREDSPLAPDNPYASSKAMAELLRVTYANNRAAGIVTVRSFNHVGPGQSPDFVLSSIAKQFAEIEAGRRAPRLQIGNAHVKRDFTDVRDVVRAYSSLLDAGAHNEIYNVCSGRSWAISRLIDEFQSITGLEVVLDVQSGKVRPGEVNEICGDPAKLRDATGWEPAIPISTTIRDLLEYWRSAIRHGAHLEGFAGSQATAIVCP